MGPTRAARPLAIGGLFFLVRVVSLINSYLMQLAYPLFMLSQFSLNDVKVFIAFLRQQFKISSQFTNDCLLAKNVLLLLLNRFLISLNPSK